MEVAEQGDGEALQAGGPTREGNFVPHNARSVGLEQYGINGEGGDASGRCEANKLSPVYGEKRQIPVGTLRCGIAQRAVCVLKDRI